METYKTKALEAFKYILEIETDNELKNLIEWIENLIVQYNIPTVTDYRIIISNLVDFLNLYQHASGRGYLHQAKKEVIEIFEVLKKDD